LEFGVKTGQGGYSYEDLVKVWSAAEELGYSSAWLYDHFYSLGDQNEPCLEAWVTLAALAAVTKRLKIGTMVTSASYRKPSLLAKMGATIDVLSHGRLIMGIGAGWHEEEYRAYGYEFPDQATRMKQLKETLIILDKMWTEDKPTFHGQYHTIHEPLCLPKPVQKPRPKILVGIATGKKTLPYLAVKYGDGVNVTSGSVQVTREIIEAVTRYSQRLGKRTSDLISSWQGFIIIGRTESEIEQLIERAARRRGQSTAEFRKNATSRGFIIGQPDECVRELRKFKEAGVNGLYISFMGDREIEPLRTFKDKVIPELR
jgi:F420-dependent oxidoreductase-like protein